MTRAVDVAAAALLVGPVAPAATAGPTYSQAYIASADGTRLHAEVFRPDVRGRVPVVLLVTPYGNEVLPSEIREPGNLLYREFGDLLDNGYAIVQVSLRGFAGSGGCGDWGGPGEQADVKASVEWAASRSWSNGRVGMWGLSYDSWTQVMALATKPRGLAAVLIQSPVVSGYRLLYMNRARYTLFHASPAQYGSSDLMSTGPTDPADAPCYAENHIETANRDPGTAYWKERDLVARARTSQVPVLWSHGFRDMNTQPDHLTALYPLLRGPKRAWVGQFGHSTPYDLGAPGVAALYQREAFDWLDAYVKGDPAALRRVAGQSRAVVQQQDSTWRRDDGWPPRDARQAAFGLRAGAFADDQSGAARDAVDTVHWTFSQRLPYAVHLSGTPRVTLSARGATPAQVVVLVYDVAPDGQARVVTRGAHAFVDGRVSLELYAQDWRFEQGHRIAVAVQGHDVVFWSPSSVNGVVTIDDPSIAVPVLRFDRRAEPVLFRNGAPPRATAKLDDAFVAARELPFRLPPPMRRR